MGVTDEDGTTRGEGEEIAARIRGGELFDLAVVVEVDAVEDDKATIVVWVAGHEGFGEVVEASAVDDEAWLTDSVDEGAAGGVAEDVGLPPFGGIAKGLADVTIDDKFARFHNLGELVLGVAVNVDIHTVNAGSEIVATSAIDVDADVTAIGAEAVANETVAAAVDDEEVAKTVVVEGVEAGGDGVGAFWFKAAGVDDGGATVCGLGGGIGCGLIGEFGGWLGLDESEEVVEGLVAEGGEAAAAELAEGEAPVDKAGEQIEGCLTAVIGLGIGEEGGETGAELFVVPVGELVGDPFKPIGIGEGRLFVVRGVGGTVGRTAGIEMELLAEFIGAGEGGCLAVGVGAGGEDESTAIGVTTTTSVPVAVGNGPEPVIGGGEGGEGGIDTLLFGGGETDGRAIVARLLPSEYLGTEHGGIGDTGETVDGFFVFGLGLGDKEEPRAIRGAVHVHYLQIVVNVLFFGGEEGEISFGGGGERFDHIFEGVLIGAMEEIEDLDRDFGIGEEEGVDVALSEIFGDGGVIGEVAIVDEGFVHANEGVGTAGVPDAPFGGVAVVADPDVGIDIFELVVADDVIGVAYHFDDEEVAAVGEDKGTGVAGGSVELFIELEGVLEDDLVFDLTTADVKIVLGLKSVERFLFDTDEILIHFWGTDIEAVEGGVIFDMGSLTAMVDFKNSVDIFFFDISAARLIEIGDNEEIILFENLAGDTKLVWVEANGGDAAPFAVTAVAHLLEGLEHVAAADFLATGETDDTTATLGRLVTVIKLQIPIWFQLTTGLENRFNCLGRGHDLIL